MADILLRDKIGNEEIYENVNEVQFRTSDGGTQKYSLTDGKFVKYSEQTLTEQEKQQARENIYSGIVDDVTLDGTSVLDGQVAKLTSDSALVSAKETQGIGYTEGETVHKISSSYLNTQDNLTSTSSTDPLSANQGKFLNERIDNISSMGRFLSLWDCTTGLPTTNPTTSPYAYRSGDYYIICKVDDVAINNLIPEGTSYTIGQASTTHFVPTTEISSLKVDDTYYYDGTSWSVKQTGIAAKVQDVQINNTSLVSGGIATIPISTQNEYGVVKPDGTNIISSNGIITTRIKDVLVNNNSVITSDGNAELFIEDNLTSTDTDKALSANQGKSLSESKVDKTTTVNNKNLSSNIVLNGEDINVSSTDTTTINDSLNSKALKSTTINSKSLNSNVTLYGSDISMNNADSTKLDSAINSKVSQTTTINNKSLDSNVVLYGTDINSSSSSEKTIKEELDNKVENSTTINNKQLNSNVTLYGSDIKVSDSSEQTLQEAINTLGSDKVSDVTFDGQSVVQNNIAILNTDSVLKNAKDVNSIGYIPGGTYHVDFEDISIPTIPQHENPTSVTLFLATSSVLSNQNSYTGHFIISRQNSITNQPFVLCTISSVQLLDDCTNVYKCVIDGADDNIYIAYDNAVYYGTSMQKGVWYEYTNTGLKYENDLSIEYIDDINKINSIFLPTINNVSSLSTTCPLSAYQGKLLNDKFSNYVLKTTKINGKELTSDITLESDDISYNNESSGLSATDVKSAIDELSEVKTLTTTLTTEWETDSTYGFRYDVSWSGITPSTKISFDGILYCGTTLTPVTKEQKTLIDKNANYIYAVETLTDLIRFYAFNVPTVNITVRLAKYSN